MSDDLVARLREGCVPLPKRWSGDTGSDRPYGLSIVDVKETDGLMRAAADRIEQLEAERDALRGISNDVLWLTRLAVSSSWPGEMAEQVERAAARVRALLDPEDGER